MAKYCILEDRAVIEVEGADSFKLLQSMITNDMNLLNSQDAIYALFLSPVGRFLFDAFISKKNEGYYLEVNKENAPKLLQRLNFFKLHSKVDFKINNDIEVIYSKEPALIKQAYTTYQDPRFDKLGFRSLILRTNLSKLSAIPDNNLYLNDKFEYTIPDGFIDYVYDKTLPPEYGAEQLKAISYTKGCYTGQEVISRAKYQGEIRKTLFKIVFSQIVEQDLTNVEIIQSDDKVGFITSSWKDKAIALLRMEKINFNNEVNIRGSSAKILKPEWQALNIKN